MFFLTYKEFEIKCNYSKSHRGDFANRALNSYNNKYGYKVFSKGGDCVKGHGKTAAFVFCVVLTGLVLLTGCGSSAMGETVVKVNGTKIGMDEMMYYIYQTEQEGSYYEELYQSYFNSSYWDMAYDEERTFRDFEKEEIMNSAVMYTIFEEKAKEAGYSLTEEEKKEVASDAQIFYDGLSENQRMVMNLDVKKITAIQEKVLLANQYYDEVMAGITIHEELEASRIEAEEYRQYDVAYIYIPSVGYDEEFNVIEYSEEEKKAAYDTIAALLPKAMETDDFDTLIPEDDFTLESGTFGFMEGDELYGANVEKEALKLENGQVVDHIIEEEDGYYIVKMINNNSTESYDEAVEEVLNDARYAAFQEVYEQIKEPYTIEINDSIWDGIVIGEITYEPSQE